MPGARERTRTRQDACGTGRRTNKPKGCGTGSRSAPIVPLKAGNRGLRDPLEGSGASRGRAGGGKHEKTPSFGIVSTQRARIATEAVRTCHARSRVRQCPHARFCEGWGSATTPPTRPASTRPAAGHPLMPIPHGPSHSRESPSPDRSGAREARPGRRPGRHDCLLSPCPGSSRSPSPGDGPLEVGDEIDGVDAANFSSSTVSSSSASDRPSRSCCPAASWPPLEARLPSRTPPGQPGRASHWQIVRRSNPFMGRLSRIKDTPSAAVPYHPVPIAVLTGPDLQYRVALQVGITQFLQRLQPERVNSASEPFQVFTQERGFGSCDFAIPEHPPTHLGVGPSGQHGHAGHAATHFVLLDDAPHGRSALIWA